MASLFCMSKHYSMLCCLCQSVFSLFRISIFFDILVQAFEWRAVKLGITKSKTPSIPRILIKASLSQILIKSKWKWVLILITKVVFAFSMLDLTLWERIVDMKYQCKQMNWRMQCLLLISTCWVKKTLQVPCREGTGNDSFG